MSRFSCLVTITAAFLTFCSPQSEPPAGQTGQQASSGAESNSGAVESSTVEIRWTSLGIPHIRADDWYGAGFGFAHSVATNTVCVFAREMITMRGEQAKYFGASEDHINADAFHRALLNEEKITEYLNYGSEESRQMDAGYVSGYNRYIETHQGRLPASCNGEPWVKPVDVQDLARMTIGVGIRYGLGRVTDEIATAQPGLSLASRSPMALHTDPETIGSNAVAFGSELTASGRGVLLGNPHYPWHGASRFHLAHLTIPGDIDVMGVGLITTPRIAIGFTPHVAWTHTVSTALRFTLFRLDLVDGNPMAYRLGDEVRNIQARRVDVETESGTEERTVYMTHLGPVVSSAEMPWDNSHVYVMRDVNYENYRSGDQYRDIQRARNVEELRTALATHQGAAFVNTIAADTDGGALYADMSAIPNVSAELIERCNVAPEGSNARTIVLNGSDPTCDWQLDASAAAPGLMPPSRQPSLITATYVSNSNDSHWLSNPDLPLEGYSPIIGDERAARSLRTRAGLVFIEEVLDGGQPVTREVVQELLFNQRHYGAELLLDDILGVCFDSAAPDLQHACEILQSWDRAQHTHSVGAQIYNEFWIAARGISAHFQVPFDVNDPVHTPRGLTVDQPETRVLILTSLETAVSRLTDTGVALDAPWGEAQFALRNGSKIGIPGGSGGAGMFSVITSSLNPESGGYNPITHGNSYIQAVTWDEEGNPEVRAILTYSQSPEPDSPYYADQTEVYSRNEWIALPFTDAQIQADLVREETLILN